MIVDNNFENNEFVKKHELVQNMNIVECKEFIESTLNKFMMNPYSETFLVNLESINRQNDECVIFSKKVKSNYCIKCRENETKEDFAFAMKSLFDKEVICEVRIGEGKNMTFNTFTIKADTIEWLFNGTPLMLDDLQYNNITLHFFNMDLTALDIDLKDIIVYCSFLPLVIKDDIKKTLQDYALNGLKHTHGIVMYPIMCYWCVCTSVCP